MKLEVILVQCYYMRDLLYSLIVDVHLGLGDLDQLGHDYDLKMQNIWPLEVHK